MIAKTKYAEAIPKQGGTWKKVYYYRQLYYFLIPAVLWYLIFKYMPMYGLTLGFKEFRFDKGIWGGDWVGLRYFTQFINEPMFWPLIRNTFTICLLKMAFTFPAPIILALMLNEVGNARFKKSIQTVSYLPHFVSWVVVVALFNKFLTPYGGPVNDLLGKYFNMEPIYFMGNKKFFYPIVVISQLWKECGWGSIIYLAAIAGIDPGLYEAATIDGAGKWKSVLHVTLPSLLPTVGILFLLNVSSLVYASFDQMYLLRIPPVLDIAEVLDTYVVQSGINLGQVSYATIIGLFQSITALVLVVLFNLTSKKITGVSIW